MGYFAALFMGFVLGLLGGGGGILTVPILVGFFGLSMTEATGSSLLVVGLTSMVGAVQGFIKKQIELSSALLIAIPSMMGAILARKILVPAIPKEIFGLTKDQVLLSAFAILMVIVGIKMLAKRKVASDSKNNPALVIAYGFAIGLLSGTLGAGGGFLILPVLTLLLSIDLERAIPTSLTIITIQSLGGFTGELGKPINWNLLLSVVGVALAGLIIGLSLREKAPRKTLQLAFAYLVFAVAIYMVSKVFFLNHS